ncbi:MAG: hypothetical protein IJW03_02950 [Clostridia bacterium]|nr:hypothetical protein [Clostridia bacterium]
MGIDMKKIILFILVCTLSLMCFSGCENPTDVPGKNDKEDDAPVIEGELDKNSDLVVTLVAYLEQYTIMYDMISRVVFEKIDDIKTGIQPLHVAFDPNDYYFVCGYYNSSLGHEYIDYENCSKYTWVGYKSESDIKEYYENTKWAVVFQLNKALTVTDIISSENSVPNMEHFQIYNPTFEGGVNVGDPIEFSETFIYLNYPDCYLNKFSQNKDTMYYCKSISYHSINTIPCVYLDGDYYLHFYRYTVYSNGDRRPEFDYTYHFGQYYDALMGMMDNDKYSITDDGMTKFYGVIKVSDFVNGVVK